MRTAVILFLFMLASCSASSAQSVADIEKDMVTKFETARSFVRRGNGYDYDKFVKANSEFETALIQYCQNPATLTSGFPDLSDEIEIVTSADSRFRIYSWDLGYGGTMRHHASVIQYQGASGKTYGWQPAKSPDSGVGGLYRSVFEIPTDDGTIYLAESEMILSRSDRFRDLRVFEVAGDAIRPDLKLIRTPHGLENEISLEYNYFAVQHDDEGNAKIFYFDPAKWSFRYKEASTRRSSKGSGVSEKFIVYRFDGKYFVRQK